MSVEVELPHREPGSPPAGHIESGALHHPLVQRLAGDMEELGHSGRRPPLPDRGGPDERGHGGFRALRTELARFVVGQFRDGVPVGAEERAETLTEALLQLFGASCRCPPKRHGLTESS